MPTNPITPEITLTVVKHLINGRPDQFIATATGLTISQIQEVKNGHGYPDLDKMEWAQDLLEKRVNEPMAVPTSIAPRIAPTHSRPSAPPAAPQRPSTPERKRASSDRRPTDPQPVTSPVREVKPSASELLVAASRSPKARTQSLGVKIAALLGDLSTRLEQEQLEQEERAAEAEANIKRLREIERLEAEQRKLTKKLRALRVKTRITKTAPTLGAPAQEVRQWAKEAGVQCPANGRVPARVRDAYDAAHAA